MSQAPTPPSASERSNGAELAIALGIVGIVLMMVIPLPGVLVDAMLAFSLAVSIGVFLIGLFMENALQFSAFPHAALDAHVRRHPAWARRGGALEATIAPVPQISVGVLSMPHLGASADTSPLATPLRA